MNTPMPADHPETRVVELLPCPFCGSEDVADFFAVTGDPYIGCADCEARGGAFQTKDAAVEAWNTRSTDQRGMLREAKRASAIDANNVLQRQRRHKGAFHRDDIIAAMQIYAEQYVRAALTGSEAR